MCGREEHNLLLAIGGCATLFLLLFYSYCLYVTKVYPLRLLERNLYFLKANTFLFARFNMYWFAVVLMGRNLVISAVRPAPTAQYRKVRRTAGKCVCRAPFDNSRA